MLRWVLVVLGLIVGASLFWIANGIWFDLAEIDAFAKFPITARNVSFLAVGSVFVDGVAEAEGCFPGELAGGVLLACPESYDRNHEPKSICG